MMNENSKTPECFGNIETVFPMGKDGLRHTPGDCMKCQFKTPCLKHAINSPDGTAVKEEVLDRSYEAGITGFWERWSRKKSLHKKKNKRRGAK